MNQAGVMEVRINEKPGRDRIRIKVLEKIIAEDPDNVSSASTMLTRVRRMLGEEWCIDPLSMQLRLLIKTDYFKEEKRQNRNQEHSKRIPCQKSSLSYPTYNRISSIE